MVWIFASCVCIVCGTGLEDEKNKGDGEQSWRWVWAVNGDVNGKGLFSVSGGTIVDGGIVLWSRFFFSFSSPVCA